MCQFPRTATARQTRLPPSLLIPSHLLPSYPLSQFYTLFCGNFHLCLPPGVNRLWKLGLNIFPQAAGNSLLWGCTGLLVSHTRPSFYTHVRK